MRRAAAAIRQVTACLALSTMAAGPADVPAAFRGVWAEDGRCDASSARLVITDTAARLGAGQPQPVTFTPHDSPAGEDALHWSAEGEVDNFVLRHDPEMIVHNTEGYGMVGAAIFRRCPG